MNDGERVLGVGTSGVELPAGSSCRDVRLVAVDLRHAARLSGLLTQGSRNAIPVNVAIDGKTRHLLLVVPRIWPKPRDSLSPQETRVLEQVTAGRTNKEIARILRLSDKTVKNYLSNAFQKLRVSRRSRAAALFIQRSRA